jgi:hypothetical protein
MATVPGRKRVKIGYPGGVMITCVGLAKELGLNSYVGGAPPSANSKVRTTRRSQALPGQSCYLLLDSGEEYKVTVVGSFKNWHKAFCVNRPSNKIMQLSSQRGTVYARSLYPEI